MTNEEFQRIVLEELRGVKEGQKEIVDKISAIEKAVNSIIEQTAELTEFREETRENFIQLNSKVDNIGNKLDDTEANNADRHLTISSKINELKDNFNTIEIVTSKNWNDIAKLKSVK